MCMDKKRKKTNQYFPDYAVPPGEIIEKEWLEYIGWDIAKLAKKIGLSKRDTKDILRGKMAITPEIAKKLGKTFATSTDLWINLERNYRYVKACIKTWKKFKQRSWKKEK